MTRIPLLIVLCTFGLCATAQKKAPLLNSGEVIEAGIKLYDDNKFKEALKEFQKVPVGDTNYVWALYESTLACTADSQFVQGVSYCQKAIDSKAEPERHPEILTQYASLLDYMDQPEKALHLYDSAIALYPAFVSLYINKGTTLLRMEKYAEAEKVFQQGLLVSPYSSSAHFKLSLCALNQGKIMQAFLAATGSLVIEPDGRFSQNCINVLNEISKSTDKIAELVNKRQEELSDNFRLIEQIVLSKIALDKNYKIIIGLDDAISRQMQVIFEKLTADESDKDFYTQFYAPLYRKVFDDKKFEEFVNYIFSNVKIPAIQEYNKKKKKDIESVKNDIIEYMNLIRATRELQASKRSYANPCYQFTEGKLFGKGVVKDKTAIGQWEFLYPAGNKKGGGRFNDKGEKEGTFTYYYYNGKVKGEETYRNGKQEGPESYYFDQGNIASRVQYKNNEPDGQYIRYFEQGGIKSTEQYSNGKLNGPKKTFYTSGLVQQEEIYAEGKRNGMAKTYYNNGQAETEGSYTNDLLNGPFKSWYNDGTLSAEGNYVQDKLTGQLKRYDENGKPSSIETYNNGTLEGEYVSYHTNGQVYTRYLNKKGKTTGDIQYFAKDGKMYSVLTFSDDNLRSGKYFDKTGKQISSSEMQKGKLELMTFTPDGVKSALTPYNNKGVMDGTKIYYYTSGKEKLRETYTQGELNGETVSFFMNGKKKYSLEYAQQQKEGYYTSWYSHGGMQEEGWYSGDALQGDWYYYNERGDLNHRSPYLNGSVNGIKTLYWPNGKKQADYLYNMDKLQTVTEYDTTGKVINIAQLVNGNGKLVSRYPTGQVYTECTYVNGHLEGAYKYYYFDGSLMTIQYYKNGLADSTHTSYYYGGKVRVECKYKRHEKTGTWKYYRTDGTLQYTEEYKADQLHGKTIYYFKNGKLDTEIDYQNGERNGLYKRYAESGEQMYQIRYENGMQEGYAYLDKNNKLVPEIPLVSGNGKLKAFYANGQVSASMEYVDGQNHGPYQLYHPNGKIAIESQDEYGVTDALRKEYYPSGKIREELPYQHDNLHGINKEYNAQGILVVETHYYNGMAHGEQRIYDDAGKLKQVRTYYYGQLLAVK